MDHPAHPSDSRFTLADAERTLVRLKNDTPVERLARKTAVPVSTWYFLDEHGRSVGPFVTDDDYQAILKLLAKP